MTAVRRITLHEDELLALIHMTEYPDRIVQIGFGPTGSWLVPDETGHFPRWSLEALARMRGITPDVVDAGSTERDGDGDGLPVH